MGIPESLRPGLVAKGSFKKSIFSDIYQTWQPQTPANLAIPTKQPPWLTLPQWHLKIKPILLCILLTLEPVRPGLTAKGSFKKSKSAEHYEVLFMSLASLMPRMSQAGKKNPFFPARFIFSP